MKLFLIDGHALIFKMYYAFLGRPMVNGKGEDTSIIYGFTKYLLELVSREKPDSIAVSFDPPGGTFRNRLYPEYKANRPETPKLVIDALQPLTEIVKSLGMPVLMVPGFEADDVIGSAARKFAGQGYDVYMVTPDKDYGQLVEDHIFQYKPGKSGTDNEVLGPAEVCLKWNISSPLQVIDILAICGDAADNVPGVQGVGPVGAAKLLGKYGSMENIYDHLDELTEKQRGMFEAARDHMALSKTLVTIKTDIPLEVSAAELALKAPSAGFGKLIDYYEMPSLRRLAPSVQDSAVERSEPSCQLPTKSLAPSDFVASAGGKVALELQGGILFAATGEAVSSGKPEEFRSLLEDSSVIKAGADMKPLLNSLRTDSGIEVEGRLEDVELMHYLLNPERSHKLDSLAVSYLGIELGSTDEQTSELSLFDAAPEAQTSDRTSHAAASFALSAILSKELGSLGKLYDTIEEPLLKVLSRMETEGVKIDAPALRDFAEGLRKSMMEEEAAVREIAGISDLNVISPKQVGEVIFEKLKLDPKAKKPRTGNWPTDEQTLSELYDRSPIIGHILEYRGLRKLLNTYIEPLPGYISPRDARVHTTFNQTLTSTGRLSSSNPNLQNIPVRTERGREIRKAFVASGPGDVIMSADYSQIELRLMAHFCSDAHLCDAFNNGVDVHSATASKIFGKPVEEVSADDRRVAKTVNFGIMYGISAFGLSQRLGCSRAEAKKIIEDYFASFPSIRSFIDATLASAREKGYVETLFGRRRYVPDVNSGNANVRAFAERNAVNAPIQGTAADIIKLAMIAVDRRLREEGLRSRMVLQIHDELLLEVPAEEVDKVKGILEDEMQNVVELSVPLTVECNYGKNWLEAH